MTQYARPLLPHLMAISLFTPLTGFASAAFENGFYIGAKVGAQEAMASWEQSNHLSTYVDISNSPDVTLQMNQSNDDGQAFHTNLMGNFAVGYAAVVDQFFLAIEGSANIAAEQEMSWHLNDHNTTHLENFFNETIDVTTELSTETELELEPDINLDIRPGLLLAKNFLLYGRVGVAFSRLSIEQEAHTTANATLTSDQFCAPADRPACSFLKAVGGTASDDDEVLGLRAGLGVEYKFTPTLGLNVDYVFTDYGDIDLAYADTYVGGNPEPDPVIDDITTLTQTTSKASVTKNTLTAGVNWYFGGKRR